VTSHRPRILILSLGFACLWSCLLIRAAWIQLIPNERLEALKRRQFETTITLGNRRGEILDRNGHELATSAPAWSLFADPKVLEEPKIAARKMAEIFRKKHPAIEKRRVARLVYDKIKNRKRRFVWLERQLTAETKFEIENLRIKGLGFIEEPRRIYPNERLLSNVLGFVGQEGRGLEGIELKFNDALSGARRKISLQKDARGRPLVINGRLFTEVPDGATLELTIDREIQYVVERELAEAVTKHEAAAGAALVLNAQTSEVLAMATLPTFNSNDGPRFSAEVRRNRVVTDVFEPGSTMKTFVMAAAIEKGAVQPNTKVFGEWGQMRLADRIIREADAKHKFGMITITEALAASSNIVSAKVAKMIGAEALRNAYLKFGFGEISGVDLPGEAKGLLQQLPWREHLLANISFGHGVAATPLQIANAYASIANGGILKRPYVIKSIRDAETGEVFQEQPKEIRRVISEETAAKMRLMLSATTLENGTGINARVPGFPVAGKTGTAQRVLEGGRGYEPGAYVSSFVGFLPVNDPKYVIFVALDKPQKDYYGSAVAAPVFAKIARFAVTRAGLSPVLITAKNVIPQNAAQQARNPTADATAWRAERGLTAAASIGRLGLASRDVASVFSAGASDSHMAGGEDIPDHSNQVPSIRVPDVVGLSLREAMQVMSDAGVPWQSVQAKGVGFVSHQSPEAGSVTPLRRVRLELNLFE
jgi:cell division protein FtsI (penicillin-binding protein 3)